MLSDVIDDGNAIHYSAVPRGTPVYAEDGTRVGTVDQVVDNYREHILDGIVIETESAGLRFVDAPEVSEDGRARCDPGDRARPGRRLAPAGERAGDLQREYRRPDGSGVCSGEAGSAISRA